MDPESSNTNESVLSGLNEDLTKQDGIGPWTGGYKRDQDNEFNHAKRDYVKVIPPDPHTSKVEDKFYFVPGLEIAYYGQRYQFDQFSARDMILGDNFLQHSAFARRENKKLDVDHKAYRPGLAGALLNHLERLRIASNKGSQETSQAQTVLHNVAKKGEKIAFVNAHGGPELVQVRESAQLKWEMRWCIVANGAVVPVDDLVRRIAAMKDESGKPIYGAIYLDACNGGSAPVDMGTKDDPVPVPVVAHTAINELLNGVARVYFPPM